jgi:hypothetical protein
MWNCPSSKITASDDASGASAYDRMPEPLSSAT